MIEFHGIIYDRVVFANTLPDLKRKASRIANGHFSAVDKMEVVIHDPRRCENLGRFTLSRMNKKAPNNSIIYGQWI